MKYTNRDLYEKMEKIDVRTINIEKHAISTNGKVKNNSNKIKWSNRIFYGCLIGIMGTIGFIIKWIIDHGGS